MNKKMADFAKLKKKKKNRFGTLPDLSQTENNLDQPELAPAEVKPEKVKKKKSRKKTGRTIQFATKVTADFDREFRKIAFNRNLKKTELLEECLKTFKEKNSIK